MGQRFEPQMKKTSDAKGACGVDWENKNDGGGSVNNTKVRLS